MLIIHGTRVRRRLRGWAAEWCEACRAMRPVQVKRVERYHHLYFIQVSRSEHLGDEICCGECGVVQMVDDAEYEDFLGHEEPLEELIEMTNPDLPRRCQERVERESRLEAGEGTAEDCEEALREAMGAAAQQCANIRAKEQTSLAEVGAFLGIIGVFIGIIGVLMSPRFGPRAIDFVYAGLLALLIVPLAWVMLTEPRRQCRKHVLPGLADRIWTLEPTREQLVAILDEYRDRKAIIGKAFSADQVLAACVKAAERWQRSA